MKNKIILLAVLFLFNHFMFGQKSLSHIPGTPCDNCKWENPNTQLNQASKVLDGNGVIATSYTHTACGLNFVQASNPLYKRGFSFAVGLTQPATYAISGIPAGAVIVKAFLYVGASGNLGTYSATITNPLSATSSFSMTQIGQDADKCWGYSGTYNYRGDVTSIIAGNGNYIISGIPVMPQTPPKDADGATLFILYSDATQLYTGSVVIADGAQVGVGSAVNSLISGFNVCGSPTLTTNFLIVSDLQKIGNADIRLNSLTNNFVLPTASQQVWNYVTAPVAPVTLAQTTANFGVTTTGDCFDVIMAGMYFQTSCQVCGIVSIPNQTICAGNNAMFSVPNNSLLTGPSYSVNPGGLTSPTGNFTVAPLVTTVYTTYVTGQNSSNVTATETQTFMVTVNPQPSASPTTTQAGCTNTVSSYNLGLTFLPSLPVPSYTVNWLPTPNTVTSTTQTSGTGANVPGVYNATIIAAGGCSTSASFTINPTPSPISFSLVPGGNSFTVTCAQPTVIISTNQPSYNYTWTNGFSAPQTGTTASFTNLNMGTWTVTAVNPLSGCTASTTFSVSQNVTMPTSSVNPVVQNIVCPVTVPVTFTGTAITPTSNVSHAWYSPYSTAPAISNGSISIYSATGPGTYTDCVIDNINGCSVCKTVTVVSSASFPTVAVVSPQQFTLGCGTTSIAAINVQTVVTNPVGASVTYTMLPPSFSGPSYTLNGTSTWTANVPGQYTVIAHQISNGCETYVPVSIISNTFTPSISASAVQNTLTCYMPHTLLSGISTNTSVSYSWAFPGPPAGQLPNDTLTVFTSTNITNTVVATYTLTVTDNINLCKSTQTLTIYQNLFKPNAIITGSNVIDCKTPTVNLTNGSTSSIPSNFFPTQPVVAAVWSGPPPQPTYSNTSNYIAFTPTGPGNTYTMVALDLNNGCTAIATKTIADNRVYPNLSPATYSLDCGASSATIFPIITGTSTGYTYSWTTIGSVNSASFSSYVNPTITVNMIGDYAVTVTNPANGCVNNVAIRVVSGNLNGDFTPSTQNGFAPLTVNFTNNSLSSSTISGTSSITTVWSFGNGLYQTTTSSSVSPSTLYQQPGTYTVTAYISKGSCIDTVAKIINVELPSKLDVPNVFTPNGDGVNDIFFLKVANITEIHAMIFDRWGNKVFETESSTGNIAWDGKTMAGKEASDGTYFYIITGKGKDDVDYTKKGNVSLYKGNK